MAIISEIALMCMKEDKRTKKAFHRGDFTAAFLYLATCREEGTTAPKIRKPVWMKQGKKGSVSS